MKVAIFTDTFTPQVNGVSRTFEKYVHYLEQQKIEYRLFTAKTKDDENFQEQIFSFKSMPFFLYPECRLAVPNVIQIRKEIQTFSPDIIHIATPFNVGLSGLYYGKKLNIPIVGSYHTNFDHYLHYYKLQFMSKWLWKYMHWFYQPMEKIFVPSSITKKELNQYGFRNVQIWSRGVDCNLFHPNHNKEIVRKKYNVKEKFILSYVGRLSPEKDLDILMETAKQLPERIKNQIHWMIVGDGPLGKDLREMAPENMTFTGYVKGHELARIYAATDLFVFPSTTETFGNVVLESLASGTPAVVARSGGVQEIVTDKKTGLLCNPKSVEDFVRAISETLENEFRLNWMSVEARKYALKQSWDSIFNELLLEYEDIIHSRDNKKQNVV
ncbi:glycosyltransferase involved in cell wall biosynthesis [Salirhabdus euzebyi]|uniref:Glycosyltransferase involved in cell wall biosynthesis n=1 Tax=Salirhabdus euzebyi TaxID=394506 RepID=A0A841QB31_9BACI|nr:glycosyltransferase family 1 protein [Salirhabdus euzebyi]MBB6455417.1 glycosyltransferase involved in cell wall biosynthesis [Salirhabdus euzebyi]